MKNHLIFILLLTFGLQLTTACTSGDDVGGEGAEVSDSVDLDSELDSEEFAEEGFDQPADGTIASEEGITDEAFESSDEVVADLGDVVDPDTTSEAPIEQAPLDPAYETTDTTMEPPQDSGFDTPTDSTNDTYASESTNDTYATDDSYSDSSYTEQAPVPTFVSLKKMHTTPYQKNGRTLNTIYMARPGDTANSIAQKIYGDEGKGQQLIDDNPHIADGVRPTDKVYYQSPNRPDDASTMLTYYEDRGVPAQTYITKEGDNIRDFSKSLLGYDNAWKEIWATNLNVDSKNEVQAGIELKYWTSEEGVDSSVVSNVATNDFPPPSNSEPMMPPPMEPPPAMEPPPMPPTTASNEVLPPAPEANVAGTMEPPPLPPPPPINPPEPARRQQKSPASLLDNLDQDTMITLGGAAVLALLLITMVARAVKRRGSRKMKLGQTQV